MDQIFKDLKVVELASVLAGPAVGTFFAELGAKVIKFENKNTGGDVTRNWKTVKENKSDTISAYYASVNYGKESKLIDFTNEEDFQNVLNQIKEADIVISNFKKGDDVKFGLDYPSLKEIKKDIIYGLITGYGEDNDKVAYDVVLQAESGMMSINGNAKSRGLKMPIAFIDLFAAHQLKEGILIAILQKYKTGKGAKVSVSLYDAALASLANQATNYLMNKKIPQPIGNLHPNIAPYGETFTTKDHHDIVLAIGTNQQFISLCKVLKSPKLAELDQYSTNRKRLANRSRLKLIIAYELDKYHLIEIEYKFKEHNIPFGKVKNLKEVLDDKAAKNLILSEVIEDSDTQRMKTAIFKIS